MPVSRNSACEFDWHRWEQSVVACRVVRVAAIVPVYPVADIGPVAAIVHYRGHTTVTLQEL